MSSDAKVWKDESGWHGICDLPGDELDGTEYDLSYIIKLIEDRFGHTLNWEIFQFGDGLGLRGYEAK
jgi:hypothetical protein